MFKITLLLCFMATALALPVDNKDPQSYIVRNEREDSPDGSYRFYYETSDGQTREESGSIVQLADNRTALVVTGSYSYIGPDGVTYKVKYVADQNGFQPSGDHIKVPDNTYEITTDPSVFIPDLPPPLGLPPNAINSLLG